MKRQSLRRALTWLLALALPAAAGAQFPRLPGGIQIPGAENALYNRVARELLDFRKGPVTTSFADVRQAASLPASFQASRSARLLSAPRTADGGFVLTRAGGYQADLQSYCLRAGTHGPSRGQGYLPAPILGSRATVVQHILEQAPFRPNVPQHDVQLLLWAIVAHTDLDKMPAEMKRTAQQLLGPRDLLALNGGVIGTMLRDRDEVKLRAALERNMGSLAPPLQRIARAESGIREQLAGSGSYTAMEQIAVLAGVAPADPGAPVVPAGQWTQHRLGFYVRYLPYGYTRTRVEVYVPDSLAREARAGQLVLNVAEELAMPASTGSQRLAITGRDGDGQPPPAVGTPPATDTPGDSSVVGGPGVPGRTPPGGRPGTGGTPPVNAPCVEGDVLVPKINGVRVLAAAADNARVLATVNKSDELVCLGQVRNDYMKVQGAAVEGWVRRTLLSRP